MEINAGVTKAAGVATETTNSTTTPAVRERLEIGSSVLHAGHSLVLGSAAPPPSKPSFAPVETNPLLAKLQAFLPQMALANETLSKVEDKSQLDIENTEGAEQVVSMDVALVPLDSNNPDTEDPEKLEDLLLSRAGSQAGAPGSNASSASPELSLLSSSSLIPTESDTSSVKRPVLVEAIEEDESMAANTGKQHNDDDDDL